MARQTNFGIGYLHFIPPSTASDLTPIEAGTLQEVSLDFTSETKELMGQSAVAVDVRTAALKVTGKAKWGEIKAALLTAIFPAATKTTALVSEVYKKTTGTISGAQFDSLVTVANFGDDLGAFDDTGLPLVKVASGATLAAGQYKIDVSGSTAIYKFYSDSTGKAFSVSYAEKSATGVTVSLSNYLQGGGTKFQLVCYNADATSGTKYGIKLYAVVLSKFSIAMKNDDFTLSDVDFTAFADSSDRIFDFVSTK